MDRHRGAKGLSLAISLAPLACGPATADRPKDATQVVVIADSKPPPAASSATPACPRGAVFDGTACVTRVLPTCSGGRPADAQHPCDPPKNAPGDLEAARAHFVRGVGLFDRALYDAALAEFRAAVAIAPRPQLSFNIGRCLERLGRDKEALDAYRRYVDGVDAGPGTAEAQQRIAALKARLGVP